MITAQPHALPLSQVLPVLISALPLKEDMEECEIVYGCLCGLVLAGHSEILPLVPQLISVFAKAVVANETPSDVKLGIGRAVMQLCSQYGDQMQSVLGSLPPEEATALSTVMKQ